MKRLLNWAANKVVGWADKRVNEQRQTLVELVIASRQESAAYSQALVARNIQVSNATQLLFEIVSSLVLARDEKVVEISPDLRATAAALGMVNVDEGDDGTIRLSFAEAEPETFPLEDEVLA